MKHHCFRHRAWPLLPLLLLAAAGAAHAQPHADSLRRVVASRQQEAARAAEVFLDRGRSTSERLRAADAAEAFLAPEHSAGAAAVARDEREDPQVRARALLGIVHTLGEDPALIAEVSTWVASPRTPPVLREAAMQAAEILMFSPAPHSDAPPVEALRALLADPDPGLRRRAFAVLAGHDDEQARGRLLEGLRGPAARAPLPPATAVELLGIALNAASLPVLHQVMVEPPDTATRIAAIRILGSHAPSRPFLVRYLQDRREGEAVRLAAMGALHACAPREFPEYALPVVEDETAGDALRVYAIHAVQYRRPPARGGQPEDAFDAAVRRLATASSSAAVRGAATDYVRARRI
jgi:hypothetical protein